MISGAHQALKESTIAPVATFTEETLGSSPL